MKTIGLRVLLAAAALPVCASTADAQQARFTPVLGAGIIVGSLPAPFASSCLQDQVGAVGVEARAGVQVGSGFDVRARFAAVQEAQHVECDLVPRVEADGTHLRRAYDDNMWGDGIRTLDLQVGFVPAPLRFLRISAGAGWELDRSQPFLVGGADLTVGSRVRFRAGAEVLSLRAPFAIWEEEWRSAQIVRTARIGEDVSWKRAWLFHAGAELPIGSR